MTNDGQPWSNNHHAARNEKLKVKVAATHFWGFFFKIGQESFLCFRTKDLFVNCFALILTGTKHFKSLFCGILLLNGFYWSASISSPNFLDQNKFFKKRERLNFLGTKFGLEMRTQLSEELKKVPCQRIFLTKKMFQNGVFLLGWFVGWFLCLLNI